MKTIIEIDELIKALPITAKKKLLSTVSQYYYVPRDYIKTMIENHKCYISHGDENRVPLTIFAYSVYDILGLNDKEIEMYWKHKRSAQIELHWKYSEMAKNPRQDNKDFINYGSGDGHGYSIRRPKLCRKTAWKRFYKLFPHLAK